MASYADFIEHHLRGLPMPELRKDPVVGRWVIIATDRAKRPIHSDEPVPLTIPRCPFCEGHEDETPPEILAYRDPQSRPDGPGWRVRVVPNRFPALQRAGSLNERGEGIYQRLNGLGAHEVIIECPRHVTSFARLADEQVRDVLCAYRDRLMSLKKDPRLVYGMLFKNVGPRAGASLDHSHSQLIVTPIVPVTVAEEMNGGLAFYHSRGRCIYCEIIQQEHSSGTRVVLETRHFLAITPYASRVPFEIWILPRQHASHFESIQETVTIDLASVLRTMLLKLEAGLDDVAYNYMVHTAPLNSPALPHYHWHLEVIPRLTRTAGFEWGTGFAINPVPPEQAAEFLKGVMVDRAAFTEP